MVKLNGEDLSKFSKSHTASKSCNQNLRPANATLNPVLLTTFGPNTQQIRIHTVTSFCNSGNLLALMNPLCPFSFIWWGITMQDDFTSVNRVHWSTYKEKELVGLHWDEIFDVGLDNANQQASK